jgi:DNA-binding response OmpR family regulator
MRIALIEDDKKQRALMHDVLVAAGHVCHGLDQNAALSGALLAEAVDMLICQEPALFFIVFN